MSGASSTSLKLAGLRHCLGLSGPQFPCVTGCKPPLPDPLREALRQQRDELWPRGQAAVAVPVPKHRGRWGAVPAPQHAGALGGRGPQPGD